MITRKEYKGVSTMTDLTLTEFTSMFTLFFCYGLMFVGAVYGLTGGLKKYKEGKVSQSIYIASTITPIVVGFLTLLIYNTF